MPVRLVLYQDVIVPSENADTRTGTSCKPDVRRRRGLVRNVATDVMTRFVVLAVADVVLVTTPADTDSVVVLVVRKD